MARTIVLLAKHGADPALARRVIERFAAVTQGQVEPVPGGAVVDLGDRDVSVTETLALADPDWADVIRLGESGRFRRREDVTAA